jgi:glutaredoxin 2
MELFVCYDRLKNVRTTGRPGGHPCGNAHAVHGLGVPLLNKTEGRDEVARLTGQRMVPVLVTDDGEAIAGSKQIVAWAKANPI